MDNHDNIPDELKGLNSLLPPPGSGPAFSVPEGYFDGLAATVMSRIKAQQTEAFAELQALSPLLAGLPKTLPYHVPENYFSANLAVLPAVLSDNTPAVLDLIDNTGPYTVPAGYFDRLPGEVLQKITPQRARVVPLFAHRWMRVATAAAVSGLLLFGGYRLLNSTANEEQILAHNPADTTQTLLAQTDHHPAAEAIKNASTEELDAFMKAVPLHAGRRQTATTPENENEVKHLLQGVSDKEMDAFLEQLPTADSELALID